MAEEQQDHEEEINLDSSGEQTEEGDGLFEHHVMEVDPGQNPVRIDVFLSLALKNVSRTRIKSYSKGGALSVNGKTVKASYKVRPNDSISFLRPYAPRPNLAPEDIPLNIAYEDKDIIMINKNPGMVVHPGIGHRTGTLMHGLLFHCNLQELPPASNDDPYLLRPGLVHRIDKDTSGLLVISKHEYAATYISTQFFHKTTDRNYYALVWGDVKEDKGTISGHIARSKSDRKKYVVYPKGDEGKHAVTHYEVLERFQFATLVKCTLETGRTHQIRVHMRYIGHTLFADTFYGGDQVLKGMRTQKFDQFIKNCMEIMPRQALHAKTLGFIHPRTEKYVHFDSELPPDFTGVLDKMRKFAQVKIKSK